MTNQGRGHPIDALLRRIAGSNPKPTAAERNHTWRILADAIHRESLGRIGLGVRDRYGRAVPAPPDQRYACETPQSRSSLQPPAAMRQRHQETR